jgi:pimeloyl-ACP methyl ester carboxylesterase
MFTEHKSGSLVRSRALPEGGHGPAILHLHPAAGPRLTPVIERLAQRHTVFIPAAPGFNGTPSHASVRVDARLAGADGRVRRKSWAENANVVAESFGAGSRCGSAADHADLVEHLVLEGPAGLRDKGTGGLPADPEARMRALYAHPERAPKETRTPQMIADTMRARDAYMNGIDYDEALHKRWARSRRAHWW